MKSVKTQFFYFPFILMVMGHCLLNGCGKPKFKNAVIHISPTPITPTLTPTPTSTILPFVLGVSTVAAGYTHTCFVQKSGLVKCFGANDSGQLGNNSLQNSLSPVGVLGIDEKAIKIRSFFTGNYALLESGKVVRWGRWNTKNGYNALLKAETVPGLNVGSGVSEIAVGRDTVCVIQGGAVKCLGDNGNGILGNILNKYSDTLVSILGLESGVTDISSGNSTVCVIHNSVVKCWGFTQGGQLGVIGTHFFTSPQTIPGLNGNDFRSVAVGDNAICALKSQTVWCWWGNGTDKPPQPPVQIAGLETGVTKLLAGTNHFCATKAGTLYCWGSQVGGLPLSNSGPNKYMSVVPVNGFDSEIIDFSVSNLFTMVVTSSGKMYGWGKNDFGQIGSNDKINYLTPKISPFSLE